MEVRRLGPRHAQDRAVLLVAGAFDLEPVAAGQHGGRGHRVQRQRAGLVGVDDGGPAQGLHVRQRLDDRLGLHQAARSRRQHGLHERRQAGRDGRDRGRYAQQHQGRGVLAPHEAEDGDHRHGDEGEQPEHLGHAVEFALQRRARALGGRDQAGDPAYLGRLTGRGHHERGRTAGDLGVLEHQVGAVAERNLPLGQGHPVLGDRGALAGERGLLHFQGGGGQDPAVRREDVSGLEQHDVTGYELGGLDFLDLAGSPHPGPGHLELGQRLDAGPGLQFLGRAHDDVKCHQPQHHDARSHLRDGEAGRADDQQHDVHGVGQLAPGDHPHARRRLGRQLVGPVLGQPMLYLAGAESLVRVDTHRPGRFLRGQGVPGGVLGGLLGGGHRWLP